LLASIDISTRAPWITQNEQHFVAGEIPHELDVDDEEEEEEEFLHKVASALCCRCLSV
jgi:hypothetical protein